MAGRLCAGTPTTATGTVGAGFGPAAAAAAGMATAATAIALTGVAGFSIARANIGAGRDSMQTLPISAAPAWASTKLIRVPRLANAAWNRTWASAQKAAELRACSSAERLAALV